MLLRLANIVETAINPALAMLPSAMDSLAARVQLIATGLQESRFEHRFQVVKGGGKGPARGFFQFERGGGCTGVVKHPAVRDLTKWMCEQRGCAFTPLAIWQAIENDDVLAAALARLLYWTDPKRLPAIGDADGAWAYYLRVWRPGQPHRHTWDNLYDRAVNEVTGA